MLLKINLYVSELQCPTAPQIENGKLTYCQTFSGTTYCQITCDPGKQTFQFTYGATCRLPAAQWDFIPDCVGTCVHVCVRVRRVRVHLRVRVFKRVRVCVRLHVHFCVRVRVFKRVRVRVWLRVPVRVRVFKRVRVRVHLRVLVCLGVHDLLSIF